MKRFLFSLLIGFAVFLTHDVCGDEFFSPYETMRLTFDFQGFDPGLNDMELVGDHLWRRDIEITESSFEVLFVAESNFSNSWNVANQPHSSLPMAHIATPFGGNIEVANNSDNTSFRFYFNDETLVYSIFLLNNTGNNLLYNGGFEERGSLSSRAAYWQYNRPTRHGDFWGNARRQQATAEARNGDGLGAIMGSNLAQGNTNGGFWQDAPVEPGLEYEAEMYFRRQNIAWNAAVKELKIEFFDFNFDNMLAVHTQPLEIQSTDGTWDSTRLTAVAPPGAAWGRVVLNFEGIGSSSALSIDDVSFHAIEANRSQDFDQWTGSTFDSCHSFSGWQICTGKVVSVEELVVGSETSLVNVARSGLALSLAPGSGHSIRSPLLPSVGAIRFWYRNGAIVDEGGPDPVVDPVSLLVQTSSDGENWNDEGTLTDITTLSYRQYQVFPNIPNPRYIRIVKTSGTNRLLLDDIEITAGGDNPRFQPFEGWPVPAESFGNHLHQGWDIIDGRVTTTGAKSGYSAEIQADEFNDTGVVSPLFGRGYGQITFSYARGNNGLAPAHLQLESSPDGSSWTPLATISNISSRSYNEFDMYFYEPEAAMIRIANIFSPLTEVVPVTIIDEPFNDGSSPAPEGWTFDSGIGEYTTAFVPDQPALQFNNNNQSITTPILTNPTNVSFYIRGAGSSGSAFIVEGRSNGNWSQILRIDPIPTTFNADANTVSISVPSSTVQIRFRYERSSGNCALDDVVIQGFAGAEQPGQTLMLDDISIRRPVEFRNQDFDTWPIENSLGKHSHQGWVADNGVISPAFAFEGNALQLRASISGGGSYFVDFEGPNETKLGYASGTVELSGIEWDLTEALIGTLDNDWKNGDRSVRLRGYAESSMTMLQDKPNGIGTISFGYRRFGTDPQVNWRVEYSTTGGSSWTQIGSDFTGGATEEVFLETVNVPGNVRIRIICVDGGSQNRRLNIDDIEITDFDGGPGGDFEAASITSPIFASGIGSISFRYRNRNSNPEGNQILTLDVQTSSDGETWTTWGDLITVDSNEYQRFDFFIPEAQQATAQQGRIRLIDGSERVVIDDIRMGPPRPPASLILSAWTDPEAPFTNDTVRIVSRAVRRNGADDVELTLHYRFGSEGPFTNSAMNVDSGNYISEVEFPPLPRGSRVEYYIEATFSGPGAISPSFYPAGGPANPDFYAIPRAKPGSAWINEVNFRLPTFGAATYEFIELAGRAGTDISGWSILVQNGAAPNFNILGYYVIPESTVIQNQHEGYGFFVLAGGSGSHLHDLPLTNSIEVGSLGIRLMNEAGGTEQEWSFNTFIVGYERGGNDDNFEFDFEDTGAGLTGFGSLGENFEWGSDQELTPGAPNVGQTFEPFDPPDPDPDDDIEIVDIDFSPSQITIITDGNTGSWTLIPEYSTDLFVQPQQWTLVPGVTDTPSGTENTLTFSPPTTNRVMMFRIRR